MPRGTHNAVPDERNKDILIYINGQLYPRDKAKVSVFDSGFLLGDGVWEGLRLNEGHIGLLDLHLDRLFEGARTIGLDIGMSRQELIDALRMTLDANDMTTGVHIRLMVTRGLKQTPSQDPRYSLGGPTVAIIAEHKTVDAEAQRQGIRLFTSAIRRGSPDSLDPKLNCHSKLHEVVALLQALEAGADEALMLDPEGFVSTCNSTNFFIVRRGEVWTSTGKYCLNGITRRKVIELCRTHGIPVAEKSFSLTDVYGADEAFVTGTFGGVTPVGHVDGREVGDASVGPITQRLMQLYRADVRRSHRSGPPGADEKSRL